MCVCVCFSNLQAYPRYRHTPIFLTSRSYLDLYSNTLHTYCSSTHISSRDYLLYTCKPKSFALINTRHSGFSYVTVGDNTMGILKLLVALRVK